MFCTNCGKENSNGAKFCQECGFKLNMVEVEDNNIGNDEEFNQTNDITVMEIKTLTQKLTLKSNTFDYEYKEVKKQTFKYENISNLYFSWTEKSMNYIPSGVNIELQMKVDGLKVPIRIFKMTFFRHKAKKIDEIHDAFEYLKEKTFDSRLQRNLELLEKNKYYEYNKTKFYLNGMVEQGDLKCNISDIPLEKISFGKMGNFDVMYIYYGIGKGFFNKNIKNIGTIIDWDKDIFYALLLLTTGISPKA